MPTETLSFNSLSIELTESDTTVVLTWRGKSNERDPVQFLSPLLGDALSRSGNGAKALVLDFSALEYMNSSTFGPIARLLADAAKGKARVLLEFKGDLRWQALSFSALRALETPDGRISIRGK